MVTKPEVTVVINYLNGQEFLGSALESIGSQDFTNFEVLIVDNSSKTPISEVDVNLAVRNVRVVRLPQTLTLYQARNVALQNVETEFVAFHDVDDLWSPIKLSRQVELVRDNRDLDLVFTGFKTFRDRRGPKLYERGKRGKVTAVRPGTLAKNYSVPMSSMFGRTTLFEELGGFNPGYEIIGDFDFTMRATSTHKASKLSLPLTGIRLHSASTGHRNRNLQVREMRAWADSTMRKIADWQSWWLDFEDEVALIELVSNSRDSNPRLSDISTLRTNRRRAAFLKHMAMSAVSGVRGSS